MFEQHSFVTLSKSQLLEIIKRIEKDAWQIDSEWSNYVPEEDFLLINLKELYNA